jgi:hypothetical protein
MCVGACLDCIIGQVQSWLESLGFHRKDANEAVGCMPPPEPGSGVTEEEYKSEILDWLYLNVPEEDCPTDLRKSASMEVTQPFMGSFAYGQLCISVICRVCLCSCLLCWYQVIDFSNTSAANWQKASKVQGRALFAAKLHVLI